MGANVRERRSFPPPPSTDAIRRLAKNAVDTVSCDVERPTVEFALRVDKKIKFIAVGGNRPYRSRFPPKRNRCCQSRFKINSTTRLHQCSIHVSQPHSQTRDTHTYTLTISRDLKKLKNQATPERESVLSRPHSRVSQIAVYYRFNAGLMCSAVYRTPFPEAGACTPLICNPTLRQEHVPP